MSIEVQTFITGTWFVVRCDGCGSYLGERMGTHWSCRYRTTALKALIDAGWTDHGSDGEAVACGDCVARSAKEGSTDEDLAQPSREAEAGQSNSESQTPSADTGDSARAEPKSADGAYMSSRTETREGDMLHWAEGPLLGFDLETTGTDSSEDVPVSYAFVYYGVGKRTEAVDGLINPGRVIPDGAIAVHGITNERAKAEGRDPEDAIAEIVESLLTASKSGAPAVGMNVSFDLKMIDACSRRVLGMSLADAGWAGPVLDILVIDRHFDKYRKGGRKLIDLCSHYGVGESENLHDAQRDVEATVAVLLSQVSKYGELQSMGLDALYAAQQGWHRDWAENFSQYLVSKGKDALSDSDVAWPLDLAESRWLDNESIKGA